MVKRLGAKKTQDYLQKTIDEIFGHLSEDEHRDLVTHYIEASPEEKEKLVNNCSLRVQDGIWNVHENRQA